MVGSVNINVPPMSIGGPAVPVNLGEAFSRGATGPSVPDTLSFDGRVTDSDLAQAGTKVVDPARLDQAVQEITSFGQNLGRSLAIRVDERNGNFIVSVQNAMTDEVVRQIPSEEVLRISALIEERNEALTLMGEKGAGGLFLDTVT
jgi:flagellar protein FlaG